jgi:hypothetical protein
MKMAYLTMTAGLCAIASCAWGGVSLHEKSGAEDTRAPALSAVEKTNKSDRIVRAFNVRGAVAPPLSVEILDFPGTAVTAVTIRDHGGSVLYRVSPTERTTVVAKRAARTPVVTPEAVTAPQESGSARHIIPRSLASRS